VSVRFPCFIASTRQSRYSCSNASVQLNLDFCDWLWVAIVTVASGDAEMPEPRGNGGQDAHFLLGGGS
jgi:hypothetical protein